MVDSYGDKDVAGNLVGKMDDVTIEEEPETGDDPTLPLGNDIVELIAATKNEPTLFMDGENHQLTQVFQLLTHDLSQLMIFSVHE